MSESTLIMSAHLKDKSDLHMARKIWHMTGIFIMFLFQKFLPLWLCWTLLIPLTIGVVAFDYLRLRSDKLNKWTQKSFGLIMRAEGNLFGWITSSSTFIRALASADNPE